jgi:hypothetical protein
VSAYRALKCVECMYLNLSVKALRSVKVNGVEIGKEGIYEQHRLKLWLVRDGLKIEGTNIVEVEYY